MTGPDILPHIGDLVLLALFIVGAVSLGLAIWIQAGKIDRLEERAADLEDRIAELERRAMRQDKALKDLGLVVERCVVRSVSEAIGDRRNGNGGDVLDEIMPVFRNGGRN